MWLTSRATLRKPSTPCRRCSRGEFVVPRHGDPRHAEQEARIDAVVAGLDALAAEHAGIRPFARGFRAVAGAQNVENAADHRDRLGLDAAGPGDRADLDAFAAARAGVGHRLDACGQRGFESLGHAASRSEYGRCAQITRQVSGEMRSRN